MIRKVKNLFACVSTGEIGAIFLCANTATYVPLDCPPLMMNSVIIKIQPLLLSALRYEGKNWRMNPILNFYWLELVMVFLLWMLGYPFLAVHTVNAASTRTYHTAMESNLTEEVREMNYICVPNAPPLISNLGDVSKPEKHRSDSWV